eukprot:4360845-Amphidinium_carterae.1
MKTNTQSITSMHCLHTIIEWALQGSRVSTSIHCNKANWRDLLKLKAVLTTPCGYWQALPVNNLLRKGKPHWAKPRPHRVNLGPFFGIGLFL